MAKTKHISKMTPEEHKLMLLNSSIKDMKRGIELGTVPPNPTRHFQVGQRVHLGAHDEVYIHEVGENELYYICNALHIQRERSKPPEDEFHVVAWFELYPYKQAKDTKFAIEERYRIRQYNSGIDSLLHMVYASHAGVDFNAEYQREHVWSIDDKVALIDSIFNNIDIGKFVFVQLRESTPDRYYQIVDGKQRLTALCEFYEDRFPYKGVVFSELSFRDKNRFTNHSIAYGLLEDPSQKAIYSTFIKMNTCGKPMDHKHIDKVKELLKGLE